MVAAVSYLYVHMKANLTTWNIHIEITCGAQTESTGMYSVSESIIIKDSISVIILGHLIKIFRLTLD